VEINLFAEKIFSGKFIVGSSVEPTLNIVCPALKLNLFDKEQEILSSGDNPDVWYEFKISQVNNFRGDLLGKIFIFRDITERKKSEEALKQSEKNLIELNEIKNRFFSILSHDLRSPFSGLLGFVEILKEDYQTMPDSERESFISEIDVTVKNIYSFLEDLLEWSRLNMGSFQADIESVNLYNEVENVFTLLKYNAKRKCIIMVNELNASDFALGDSSMVKLLLRNLISNAIKFSHEGDRIRVYAKKSDSQIEISVEDTGTGIPPEALPKLFRLDVKYTTPGTANERGSGIGLVLCKEIVDKLGGNIKVKSELGKGSIFTFSLPLK
jgi:signal transduction histidine kinase